MDATIIEAPNSTKNKANEHDPEIHQTKKGNQWHFGMKASLRAKVEHPFRIIKCQFGFTKTCYRD